MRMDSNQKVAALRSEMKKENVAMYMLTSDDEFLAAQGCIHDYWKIIRWLTGFTGEAGFVIVTQDKICLWTDSRFHIQAAAEIHIDGFEIFNTNEVSMEHYLRWIREYFESLAGGRYVFGIDGHTISTELAAELLRCLAEISGKRVDLNPSLDLIGRVWKDRPARGYRPVFEIAEKYAGRSRPEKAADVRAAMRAAGVDHYVVGGLEGTPWLTNLRGHESASPLFGAHALVTPEKVEIFCKVEMIPEDVRRRILQDGFCLLDVDEIEAELGKLPPGAKVFLDSNLTNYSMRYAIPESCELVTGIDLINRIKAVKNPTEIAGFRKANINDSVALFRMFRDVKQKIQTRAYTERDCYHILERYRELVPEYLKGSSAVLSCAYNINGSMPHYNPTEEHFSVMYPSGNMVVDAQAHSMFGTTDTCRVIYLGPGEHDEQMRIDYTWVLKSLIAVSRTRIRKGMGGVYLDSVARAVLAEGGAYYGHGTGHGIGFISSPHEGPMALAQTGYKRSWSFEWLPVEPGNILSVEPGVYREGKYGIRLENNFLVVKDGKNEFGEWYRLETLFYHPYERDLIEVDMLTDQELAWVNEYHKRTYELVSGCLETDELEYLEKLTAPLVRAN